MTCIRDDSLAGLLIRSTVKGCIVLALGLAVAAIAVGVMA